MSIRLALYQAVSPISNVAINAIALVEKAEQLYKHRCVFICLSLTDFLSHDFSKSVNEARLVPGSCVVSTHSC